MDRVLDKVFGNLKRKEQKEAALMNRVTERVFENFNKIKEKNTALEEQNKDVQENTFYGNDTARVIEDQRDYMRD
jgi:hypothetical protein